MGPMSNNMVIAFRMVQPPDRFTPDSSNAQRHVVTANPHFSPNTRFSLPQATNDDADLTVHQDNLPPTSTVPTVPKPPVYLDPEPRYNLAFVRKESIQTNFKTLKCYRQSFIQYGVC